MVEDVQTTSSSDQQPRFAKYFIDPAKAESTGRSLPILLASRYRHVGQQGIEDEVAIDLDPQDIIDLIREHCSQTPDFLLPDTPLKETIFRVLLAHGNEPMDAEQISAFIGQKWAMTQFPR
ncbi:MAG: hypothetical protein F4X94_07000, partial [Dehalococcoidia bacterium]|nr:hypothetical protein [Dehalococcoidia bacterium]